MTPTAATEVDLLERCRAGDADAYRSLVALWGDRLLRLAVLVAGDRGRGEAALRDALLAAWSDLPTLHAESALQPWLVGKVVAAARARRAPGAPAPGLRGCLDALDDEDRAATILLAYGELRPAEVVAALGWDLARGARRLRRATRAVRACAAGA